MATPQHVEQVMVDCSVVCKWKLVAEPHASQSKELLLDWQAGYVERCAPDLLPAEIMSTFLKATRMQRLSPDEAWNAIKELSALPIHLLETKPVVEQAFVIALQHQQRAYDCFYVALATRGGMIFWTSDERLYNALNKSIPFMGLLATYQPKRQRP